MVTKLAPKGYERTLDMIVGAFGKAPDFVFGGFKFTLDEVFGDIFYGIETVKEKTKSPERLAIIEQVINKLNEARAALEANQDCDGIMALADAKELFKSIKKAPK